MPAAEDPVRVDLHTLVPDPPTNLLGWDGLAGRIRRRRRLRLAEALALGVALVVVAATGPVWWPTGAARPSSWELPTAPSGCVGAAPGCGAGPGTPADLAGGRWVGLPAGPLSPRAGYGYTWTGTRLVIWGGQSASTNSFATPAPLADGASFDPAADTWQQLARSPLSARAYPVSVWTGRQVLFWGGQAPGPGGRNRFFADGAGYDPATNTWQKIAPAPLSARAQAYGVWTGTRMIVFGGTTAADQVAPADGAVYDPASDS